MEDIKMRLKLGNWGSHKLLIHHWAIKRGINNLKEEDTKDNNTI